MKNLIIGGCANYGINELKPWVLSINEVSKNSHKVMCVDNITQETRDWLKENNFELVDMPKADIPVHVLRFLSIYEYLRKNYQEYDFVITTDVKDVYFQKDPFEFLKNNIAPGSITKIICGSECLRYMDEEWGNQNLMQAYGPYVHEIFKHKAIMNVGVLGGTSEYIKDLVFNIFINGINRPIPIVDQAVFNVLINTQPYADVVYKCEMSSGWACQAGTVADPSKIDKFRSNLLEDEPKWIDGIVKTSTDKTFYIVHQYDRVPLWKKTIAERYGQKQEQNMFVYRV